MKIIITGDLVINQPYDVDNIDTHIIDLFKQSDFNIVNLEAPVTRSQSKIIKTGPHLKADKESTLSVLKALDVDVVTLANNHVLDYDEQGVLDTIEFCKENSIITIGAGKNKEEASKSFYLDTPEGKIAIINIAENEWASATAITAGANGMDIIDDVKQIQEAQSKSDFVFVIVHGGHEYYNLPSPRMQKQYRFYIDNGADMVIGHHTHCISGSEVYKGKPIYYSLGNFLFTKPNKHEDWYKGMILQIEILDDKSIISKPIFVEQSKVDFGLSLIKDKSCDEIQSRFNSYTSIILDEAQLKLNWEKYVIKKSNIYDNYWSPLSFVKNKWIKKIKNRLQLKGDNKVGKALLLNLMRCETHYDMSKEVLNLKIKDKK